MELAEAIADLRRELTTALQAGQEEALRFKLGPVELSFQLQVAKKAGANAGVRFWVVSAGGQGELSKASTHQIKLTLQPVDRAGGDISIASAEVQELPP